MHSHNVGQEQTYVNKCTRIFAWIILAFIIVCVVCTYGGDKNNKVSAENTREAETTANETLEEDINTSESITLPEHSTLLEDSTVDVTVGKPKPNINISRPEESVPELPVSKPKPPVSKLYLNLTDSEKLILATLIRLECGGSSYETQMAVASVVVNRMQMWGLTLRQAVFQENVFSPARLIDQETGKSYYNPSKDGRYSQCWTVVDDICAKGPTLPYYVIYFRSGHYHSWATPYAKIGSLYFSYAEKYK